MSRRPRKWILELLKKSRRQLAEEYFYNKSLRNNITKEFEEPIKELRQRLLFEQKVFTGVSGTNVIRLLPPLCLTMAEADEFLERFRKVLV